MSSGAFLSFTLMAHLVILMLYNLPLIAYEFLFQLEGHSLDKRCHMVQRDGQMVIDKVTAVGEVGEKTLEFSCLMSFYDGVSFYTTIHRI